MSSPLWGALKRLSESRNEFPYTKDQRNQHDTAADTGRDTVG